MSPHRALPCEKIHPFHYVPLFLIHDTSAMKVSDILTLLRNDGWMLVATRGSHRQFKHANKSGHVTVAEKPSDDLAPGTLNSIRKQAGLKE